MDDIYQQWADDIMTKRKKDSTKYGAGYKHTKKGDNIDVYTPHSSTIKSCYHDGDLYAEPIITIDNKNFYIGGKDSKYYDVNLIVDFGGVFTGKSGKQSVVTIAPTEEMRIALDAFVKQFPDRLAIKWPDFGSLQVEPEFWPELFQQLPEGNILFCCQGGHGRSGTALAAIMIAVSGFNNHDAVEFLRSAHCESVVETPSQEKMLAELAVYFGTAQEINIKDK